MENTMEIQMISTDFRDLWKIFCSRMKIKMKVEGHFFHQNGSEDGTGHFWTNA